jgi:hypothetical protein
MFTSFTVELDGGNAAMQTKEDVAGALRNIITKVERGDWYGYVFDTNGNIIGSFDFHNHKR